MREVASLVGTMLFASIFVVASMYACYSMVAGAMLWQCLLMTIACCLISTIMSIFMAITAKRSEDGNRLLGQVRGFRTFLSTVEKSRIEAMVDDNPNFFYDILSYAYALGVTKAWVNKFESMSLKAPDWYDSPTGTAFSIYTMNSFMGSTMTSISSSMSSSPSSSDSGGGFSGGGSGGGGGSSW